MTSEVFAVDGDRAGDPVRPEFRDIWLLRFEEGRCAHYEEWAYWPDRPNTARSQSGSTTPRASAP
ncbi:MAG: hypothetical protein ACRDM7_17530 [Thermoleophilaceae bacterium]